MEQCQATKDCQSKRAVRKLVEGKVVSFCLVCNSPIEQYARGTSLSASIDRGDSVPEALKSHHNKRRRAEMDNAVAIIDQAKNLRELNPTELMKPENRQALGNLKDMLTTKGVTFKGTEPLKPQDVVRLGIELEQITAVGGILLKDLMLYGPKWYIGVEGWIGLITKKAPGFQYINEVVMTKEAVEAAGYKYLAEVKYVRIEILVRDQEIEEIHKANGDKVIRRVPVNRVFATAIGLAGGPFERNPIVKQGHAIRQAANRAIRRAGVLMGAMPQMDVQIGVGANVGGKFTPVDEQVLIEASVSQDVDASQLQAMANEQDAKEAQPEEQPQAEAETPETQPEQQEQPATPQGTSPLAEEQAETAPKEEAKSPLSTKSDASTPTESAKAQAEPEQPAEPEQATLADEIPY